MENKYEDKFWKRYRARERLYVSYGVWEITDYRVEIRWLKDMLKSNNLDMADIVRIRIGGERGKMQKEELRDLTTPDYKKAIEAVEKGDFNTALSLISGFKEMTVRMHDALMDMVGLLMTYIAENYGEDELEKALRFRHTTFSKVHGDLSRMGIEQLLDIYSLLWRGHNSKFSIIEEKDRIVVKQEFCGSGTRMRKRGSTDPNMHLGYTKEKHKWCWDKKGVSYYCTHCCMIEIMSVEQTGRRYPICFVEYGENVDDPCYWYFYKDEKAIPKKFMQQIGL